MEIADKDIKYEKMKKFIEEQKKSILEKYKKLNAEKNDPVLLSEYKKYLSQEKNNIKEQIKAFEIISDHLDNIAKMQISQGNVLEDIKNDQKRVLKEIINIKKEYNDIKNAEK